MAVLDEFGKAKWEDQSGRDRVQLAVLRLSHGDIAELRERIMIAKRDSRDVMAAAEYPGALERWASMTRLSDEERQKIYDADWKQYSDWLGRE